jgi:imidazole glycerol-phosphate synthase subunit HisH
MERHVCILNYGLGNLSSVSNALASLDIEHEVSSSPYALARASHIILPGVGSFKEGMDGLERAGLMNPLRVAVLDERKPILGICLGMQLLADVGFEHGEYKGLSFLAGRVELLPTEESKLPLPHIGWNSISFLEGKKIVEGLTKESDFYFIHSYRFVPQDEKVIVGIADYGVPIVAIVESGNIFGTQFHPEKSAEAGLQILKNFSQVVQLC